MTVDEFKQSLFLVGWTQATFSRKTGVSANTVSRWVTGEIPQIPKWVDSYLAMAKALKTSANLLEK